MTAVLPWYQQRIAAPPGIQPTAAQLWRGGTFYPHTNAMAAGRVVGYAPETPKGVPKLELIAKRVVKRTKDLGVDQKKMLELWLSDKTHLSVAGAAARRGGGYSAAAAGSVSVASASFSRGSAPALIASNKIKAAT